MGPFSLYYSLSFNHLLDNVPAVIAPFTFSAVRPISINGSLTILVIYLLSLVFSNIEKKINAQVINTCENELIILSP